MFSMISLSWKMIGRDASLSWFRPLILAVFLLYFFFLRNSRQYWHTGTRCCGINDPFDMSYVFEDFKARAEIGASHTARYTNKDGLLTLPQSSEPTARTLEKMQVCH